MRWLILVLAGCAGGRKDADSPPADDCSDGSVGFREGIALTAEAYCKYAIECVQVPGQTYEECLVSYTSQYEDPECEFDEEGYFGGLVCECIASYATLDCSSGPPATCAEPWFDCGTTFVD